MPIPAEIKKEHLEKSFEEILRNGIPSNNGAVNTFIERKKILFPIKYPIALANKFANGFIIPTKDDKGNPSFTTHEAINFFNDNFPQDYKVWRFEKEKAPPLARASGS